MGGPCYWPRKYEVNPLQSNVSPAPDEDSVALPKPRAQGAPPAAHGRIDPLDGLRGLAAMWVFAGHALNISNAALPIVGRPGLAVDLFMILSGGLMVFQATLREGREPMASPATWRRFWTRRFFRIAPVFYTALAVALIAAPWIGEARAAALAAGGGVEPDWARYHDQGLGNILAHLTFVFGLSPDYSFRTPLPDWSISLEMQFYLLFPFLLLFLRRVGQIAGALVLTAAAAALWLPFGGWLDSFPQPSFLPLKLNLFFAGMLIMHARALEGRGRLTVLAAAILLAALPLDGAHDVQAVAMRAANAALVAAMAVPGLLSGLVAAPVGLVARLMSSRPLRWLGDVSYGVYLIHLMALPPAVALVAHLMPGQPPLVRAAAAFALACPVVLALAWAAFRWLEKPGIALGRRLTAAPAPG